MPASHRIRSSSSGSSTRAAKPCSAIRWARDYRFAILADRASKQALLSASTALSAFAVVMGVLPPRQERTRQERNLRRRATDRCWGWRAGSRGMIECDMSLIVAIKDEFDAVIASDGRVLGERHEILSNESLKTVALNRQLCLGIAGHTPSMREVLGSLGLRARRAGPEELLTLCEVIDCPIDADYPDAHRELSSVFRWMTRRPRRARFGELPAVLLVGRRGGSSALDGWGESRWAGHDAAPRVVAHAAVGMLPEEGSAASSSVRRLIAGGETTVGAESRLTEAIRRSADHFGTTGPVSRTVFVRRLSDDFRLVRSPGEADS